GINSEFGANAISSGGVGGILKKRADDDDKQKHGENNVFGLFKRGIVPGSASSILPFLGAMDGFGTY
ncbi:31099_t:CDS:1, partial [Racocetra persica]